MTVWKRTIFASIPVLSLVLLAELFVRLTSLAESCPDWLGLPALECDPILGHRLAPMEGRPVNRLNFRGPDFGPKSPGVYRIITLGDSCTVGAFVLGPERLPGWVEPYPKLLESMLARRADGVFEVLNAGTSGYSSYHGVMLLRSKLRGLDPDLITVRYGWNDHFSIPRRWRGALREPRSRLGIALQDLLLRTALYPFARRLALEIRVPRVEPGDRVRGAFEAQREWTPAVPLQEYRRNLRRIVEIGHARGAEVVLLTAPVNPSPSEKAAERMAYFNHLSFEQVMQIHDSYVEATREVSAELGVPLIDMHKIYRTYARPGRWNAADVPHPNQRGHKLEAYWLYAWMKEHGIVRPKRSSGAD